MNLSSFFNREISLWESSSSKHFLVTSYLLKSWIWVVNFFLMASFSFLMMFLQMMLNSYRIWEIQVSVIFPSKVCCSSLIFLTASVGIHSLASWFFFFFLWAAILFVTTPKVSQICWTLWLLRYLAFLRISVSEMS